MPARDLLKKPIWNQEQISVPLPSELRAYVRHVAQREYVSEAAVIAKPWLSVRSSLAFGLAATNRYLVEAFRTWASGHNV
jgi:hypothetical protein